jgi:phosphoglycolate phosphatase-like HAD superfamily hydrolase
MSNIKVVLWDFDGVILNSNEVRDKGFEEVLRNFPEEQVAKLLSYHRKNGGLSRYVKFRYFFEEIRGEEITDDDISHWATKFSAIMLSSLKDRSLLIRETNNFIQENHLNYKMHIVSGSDQTEFKSIHGSQTPKNDLVKMIIEEHNYDPSFGILIGDSINDYEAAEENELHFQAFGNTELDKLTTLKLF